MPRQATIEIPSPKVNRISFRKDKGLKFRSYMIRVKSIKKRTNKAKGHACARRGVGDKKGEQTKSRSEHVDMQVAAQNSPGQIPSHAMTLHAGGTGSLVPFSFARDTGARRCRCSVAFDQL